MIRVPNAKVNVPAYHKMLWPTLQALKQMGGSGTVQEIMDRVIEIEGYSEAQQSVIHGKGPGTEIGCRLPWARTYLKNVGAVENSSRGIWTITEFGSWSFRSRHGSDSYNSQKNGTEEVCLSG